MTKAQFEYFVDAVAKRRHIESTERALLAGASEDDIPEYESSLDTLEEDEVDYDFIEEQLSKNPFVRKA